MIDQELNMMEFLKAAHYSESQGWLIAKAQTSYARFFIKTIKFFYQDCF